MDEHLKTILINRYIGSMYRYGVMTLLYMLKQYEKQEAYNECYLIKAAIDQHNNIIKDQLPTHYEDAVFTDKNIYYSYDVKHEVRKGFIVEIPIF